MSTKALIPRKKKRYRVPQVSRSRCQTCGEKFSFWDHMIGAAGRGYCADCLPGGTLIIVTTDEEQEPHDGK